MGEKIVFVSGTKMAFLQHQSVCWLTSQYLQRYNHNRKEIKERHAWKTEGTGAKFLGAVNPEQGFSEEHTRAEINGIAFVNNGEEIVYSISVNDFSGLFIKDPTDDTQTEGHILHDNKTSFSNLDFNTATNELAIAIRDTGAEKNIAVLDIKTGHYKILTEGESVDDNPTWGRRNLRHIYYDSSGIGFDDFGNVAGFGPKVICSLDLDTGELREEVTIDKHDCFKPKEDSLGNLYFVKRPVNSLPRSSSSLKDVLLIPIRLLKAVYNWLEFFTMRYTGETFTTGGKNPAKSKTKNPEQVFIEGNLINVEKTLKENKTSGEEFPGIVPRNWELMRKDKNGDVVCVKKGILDYDISFKDEIVYSNGTYLVKITDNGKEQILQKTDMATKIHIFGPAIT